MSQKKTVLKHLKSHGSITQLEATYKYQITRLSERIREIERDGIPIRRTDEKTKNGKGVYKRYHLKKEVKQDSLFQAENCAV